MGWPNPQSKYPGTISLIFQRSDFQAKHRIQRCARSLMKKTKAKVILDPKQSQTNNSKALAIRKKGSIRRVNSKFEKSKV